MAEPSDGWVTPDRLRNLPSRLLSHTATLAERLVTEGLAAIDARRWHYAVLVALDEGGSVSQATLSQRAGLFRSDLVAVLNELAAGGYIERTPDATDARRNVITITAGGRRRLRRLDRAIARIQDELLEPLSASERDTLVELLRRVTDRRPQGA